MFSDFRKRERVTERETLMWERNIDLSPPVLALTEDWTPNIAMYGLTLQPTEPPRQSCLLYFWKVFIVIALKIYILLIMLLQLSHFFCTCFKMGLLVMLFLSPNPCWFSLLDLLITERYVKLSYYDYRFVCFSLYFSQFLLHIFWSSVRCIQI